MAKPEISKDIRTLVASYMLQAGLTPGDRVPYELVRDLMEQASESVRPKTKPGTDFAVDGIVAIRDGNPYVRLLLQGEPMVQLDMQQAREVATNILQMAARTEADAGLIAFLKSAEFDTHLIFMSRLRSARTACARSRRFELRCKALMTVRSQKRTYLLLASCPRA